MNQWHLSVDEVMFSGIVLQRVDTIPKGRQGVEKSRDVCDSHAFIWAADARSANHS